MGFLIDRFRPQVFFDVGAAYGYFALVAASRIDSPPTVHAFEMRPDRHEQVKETLVHHNYQDRAFAHLVGLSDVHKGAVDIWFSGHRLFERKPSIDEAEGPWWMRLKFLFHSLTGRKPSRKLTGARVPVTTIDHFCAEHDIEPDLIKIDVDGYEGKVLRGASETLARNRPLVLLELHREKLMPAGETRQGAVAVLLSQGYKACLFTDHKDLDNCRILPIELGEPLLLRQQTSHILFVPRA
jgi:FkbM family methyltransferase